ncbi:MAG: type II toxin-antitoxin system HipA family toxin [Candidatus Enteromonas sp.]
MDVNVKMWGTKVGVLRFNEEHNTSAFQYDRAFQKSRIELSPILMPLSDATYAFGREIPSNYGLPPLLRDSLPDTYGNKVINLYLASLGREENSLNPAERLLYEGKRGMGALEFEPAKPDLSLSSSIDIDALAKIADDVYEERKAFHAEDIQALISVSTSAGGARTKAVVQYNPDTHEFKSGQVDECSPGFDFCLIKFDNMKEEAYFTRIEYAYYLMARDCGIDIRDSYLLSINGKYHFLTKRFDRIIKNGKVQKVHAQTLASLYGLDYDVPCQIDYEEVFNVLKRLKIPNKNEQWFRRVVFNAVMRNQDDHVKNTSFVMDRKGVWDLSNAYDLTYANDPTNRWLSAHQMSIHGKSKGIELSDLLAVAKKGNVLEAKALEIIDEIQKVARSFAAYAKKAHLPKAVAERLAKEFLYFDL